MYNRTDALVANRTVINSSAYKFIYKMSTEKKESKEETNYVKSTKHLNEQD